MARRVRALGEVVALHDVDFLVAFLALLAAAAVDFAATVRLDALATRAVVARGVTARSGLSADQVLEAMELGTHQYPVSLDVPTGDGHRGHHDPPTDDRGVDWMASRALAGALLERLPEREQEILRLRFAEQLSQAEIAARVGVSQMHVSRLLARTLARLRRMAGAA